MRTVLVFQQLLGVVVLVAIGVPAIRTGRMEGIVEAATLLALVLVAPLAAVGVARGLRRLRDARRGGAPGDDASGPWPRDPAAEAAALDEGVRARRRAGAGRDGPG